MKVFDILLKIKEKYKDYLLFYRLGDFYEMFFDDAILASRVLELTLTGRDCGEAERAPMCGVPYHSAEGYIARLIEKGNISLTEIALSCGFCDLSHFSKAYKEKYGIRPKVEKSRALQ